jgi:hypothetical protein
VIVPLKVRYMYAPIPFRGKASRPSHRPEKTSHVNRCLIVQDVASSGSITMRHQLARTARQFIAVSINVSRLTVRALAARIVLINEFNVDFCKTERRFKLLCELCITPERVRFRVHTRRPVR